MVLIVWGSTVLQWSTLLVQPFCEEEVLLVSAGFSLGSPASSTHSFMYHIHLVLIHIYILIVLMYI